MNNYMFNMLLQFILKILNEMAIKKKLKRIKKGKKKKTHFSFFFIYFLQREKDN